jgi:uncharacterized protein YigA (DUF484 family)
MNSKGIILVITDQLERLRKEIHTQEEQCKNLINQLRENREMEAKLSELVKE